MALRARSVSMTIRSIALLAIIIPGCLFGASKQDAPLAVYYSIDAPHSAALLTEMQAELDRILAPADIRVDWRPLSAPRDGTENFQSVVVFRFQGSCGFSQDLTAAEMNTDVAAHSLARTDVIDGHVLPFAYVDCEKLRIFVAPALKALGHEAKEAGLGRAMARVSAHEIYHMLTGSEKHASHGIARASHTRAELTAGAFLFAPADVNWLRAWAKPADQPELAADRLPTSTPVVESGTSESFDVAGR